MNEIATLIVLEIVQKNAKYQSKVSILDPMVYELTTLPLFHYATIIADVYMFPHITLYA